MGDDFKNAVKAWVIIDDHEASLRKQIQELRKEKGGLTATILDTMSRRNIGACNLGGGAGQIKMYEVHRKKPPRPDGIRATISELFAGDEQQAERVADAILSAREEVVVPKLKRVRQLPRKTKGAADAGDGAAGSDAEADS